MSNFSTHFPQVEAFVVPFLRDFRTGRGKQGYVRDDGFGLCKNFRIWLEREHGFKHTQNFSPKDSAVAYVVLGKIFAAQGLHNAWPFSNGMQLPYNQVASKRRAWVDSYLKEHNQ